MFNQHYLNPMFLPSKCQNQVPKKTNAKNWKFGGIAADDNEYHVGDKFEESFLDRSVSLDEKLATRRDSAIIEEAGIMRRESGLEFGNGQVLKGIQELDNDAHANDNECLMISRTRNDGVVAEEARGPTVKKLSRLWKYLGGKSPEDNDHKQKGFDTEPHREHHKHRLNPDDQRKPRQRSGEHEQQRSSISVVIDVPKSSLPHSGLTTHKQSSRVSSLSLPVVSVDDSDRTSGRQR